MENWRVLLALAGVTLVAGLLRGFSGFGGGLVMAPIFTLLVGGTNSVVLIALVHLLTAFQGLRQAIRLAPPRLIAPLILSSVLATPSGVLLLGVLDPHWTKTVIGGLVVIFAMALRFGLAIPGGVRPMTSITVGVISGILNGFCGIGGPPAVLYLLNTGGNSAALRASFLLLFAALYPATVAVLALFGLIGWPALLTATLLAPVYFLATGAGLRLFQSGCSRYFGPVCTATLGISGLLILLNR